MGLAVIRRFAAALLLVLGILILAAEVDDYNARRDALAMKY